MRQWTKLFKATIAKEDTCFVIAQDGKSDIRLDRDSNKSSKMMPSLISLTYEELNMVLNQRKRVMQGCSTKRQN